MAVSRRDRLLYYGYWIVLLSFTAQFVTLGIYSYVLGPFMLPMVEALDWTRAEYTIPRAVAQVVMGVTGFFIGAYVDRFGGRRLMLTGASVLVVALALHSTVSELWHWVLLNGLILTIGCALAGNLVVNVTIAKWFVERRGRAVAWSAMGVSFAGVVVTPAITWVIDGYGWQHAWLALAVASGVILFPVAALMRRAPEDHGLHPDGKTDAEIAAGGGARAAADFAMSLTRAQALRTFSFYGLVVTFGFFTMNIVVMLLQSVPYLTDAGYGRDEAAFLIVIASIPAMVSKPIWGFFIDRLRPKPLAALGAGVTGGALFVIVFAVSGGWSFGVYLGFFLLGTGWGGMIPLQEVIWASYFGRRYLGAVRSAGLPISLLFGALAPLAVSYYHDIVGAYDGALLVVAGLNVMSGVMLLFVPPPKQAGANASRLETSGAQPGRQDRDSARSGV